MRIILTHEQADFDALASQLGASLLDKEAFPVLPQRINRNVKAFLTIYGVELPFVERRDLPKEKIDTVTLVDTQSMVSLRGMHGSTRVQIVDHHDLHEDLPAEWRITVQPTGATATLFVEAIQERATPLSVVQSTLLLLGIYEDTGSLTYTRTTSRDLRAAAFLLQEGASLQIAGEYLNHPLSLVQQSLYDQLRAVAETHQIHGHTIIIAKGNAQEMNEELSSIAHKLRDLLDPEGLILLINIRGGVQLIARSTDDRVDVAGIAEHFGGGGHKRAAAAMVKQGDLDMIHRELLKILPSHIRPQITVAQIMSRGPQLIRPDTPVYEVSKRMQRFGYEGYPVVDGGKVIGLLTRRVVDRAIGHQLNLTARELMEAGEVTVRQDDSIEMLQSVMADTGWGQIPVVDQETGRIVGIVTRTDLLKTLAPEPSIPGHLNLATRLEEALPVGHLTLLKAIAEVATGQRKALYVVGGFVRDLLLGHPSLDFDLVVEGDAISLAEELSQRYSGRITTHSRFGTAKWFVEDLRDKFFQKFTDVEGVTSAKQSQFTQTHTSDSFARSGRDFPRFIDLITARREFYSYPTALPTVERGSIKLDLHRRDFTINTLALRLDGLHYGELHDYWGGYNDLCQGLIRVLHSLSFVDDPTRMLRAVRFEQRFDFQIEDRTLELIQAALNPPASSGLALLESVSGDRIRHELDHILDEPKASQMLDRLHQIGLLKAIHDKIPWDDWSQQHIADLHLIEPESYWGIKESVKGDSMNRSLAYILWLIRTPEQEVQEIIRRLKIRRDLETILLASCRLWKDLSGLGGMLPSAVVARLDGVPKMALFANYLACSDERIQNQILTYVSEWQHVKPVTSGHYLREIGLATGPIYSEILATLRGAWLDGEVTTYKEEKALLEKIIRKEGIKIEN